MKYSAAMLKGFRRTNGRQWKGGGYVPGNKPEDYYRPEAVCVLGAINLALTDFIIAEAGWDFAEKFEKVWGIPPTELNDEGMSWVHLYGMTVAAGL